MAPARHPSPTPVAVPHCPVLHPPLRLPLSPSPLYSCLRSEEESGPGAGTRERSGPHAGMRRDGWEREDRWAAGNGVQCTWIHSRGRGHSGQCYWGNQSGWHRSQPDWGGQHSSQRHWGSQSGQSDRVRWNGMGHRLSGFPWKSAQQDWSGGGGAQEDERPRPQQWSRGGGGGSPWESVQQDWSGGGSVQGDEQPRPQQWPRSKSWDQGDRGQGQSRPCRPHQGRRRQGRLRRYPGQGQGQDHPPPRETH